MENAFTLTDTHRQWRDTLRKFAEDRVAPNAAAADRDSVYPQASFDACREMELPALGIPEVYGGAGADMITQAIMAEEICGRPTCRRSRPASTRGATACPRPTPAPMSRPCGPEPCATATTTS